MTYDELLEKIHLTMNDSRDWEVDGATQLALEALRAVVELANDVAKTIPGDYDEYQIGYKDAFVTVIKAIEKEMK